MDYKNILTLMIGALVGIVVLSAFVPVVVATQTDIGEPITITNPSLINDLADYYDEDVTMIITSDVDTASILDATITINDYEIPLSGHTITVPIVFSEKDYLQIESSTSTSKVGIYRFYLDDGTNNTGDLAFGHTYTLTYSHADKTLSMTNLNISTDVTTTVIDSMPVDYFFAIKENGSYSLTRQSAGGGSTAFENMIVTQPSIDDGTAGVFRVVGAKTIEADTVGYAVGVSKYGIHTWCSNPDYTVTATVGVSGLQLANGTTDLYTNGTPSINVTITKIADESETVFSETPEVSWVLHTVNGHATKGAMFEIIGLLPLIAGVGLLLAVCIEVFRRYY